MNFLHSLWKGGLGALAGGVINSIAPPQFDPHNVLGSLALIIVWGSLYGVGVKQQQPTQGATSNGNTSTGPHAGI